MLNDDEDDITVEVDPELDAEIGDAEGDDEADVALAARKPKRPAAKKPAVKARKPARSAAKAAPAKAAAKPPKKAAKPAKAAKAKKPAAKKAKKTSTPPADLTGVTAGAHTLWVSKDVARVLTSKDRRKLKALLKRAEKRGKSKK
jgi:hypothetical protein